MVLPLNRLGSARLWPTPVPNTLNRHSPRQQLAACAVCKNPQAPTKRLSSHGRKCLLPKVSSPHTSQTAPEARTSTAQGAYPCEGWRECSRAGRPASQELLQQLGVEVGVGEGLSIALVCRNVGLLKGLAIAQHSGPGCCSLQIPHTPFSPTLACARRTWLARQHQHGARCEAAYLSLSSK